MARYAWRGRWSDVAGSGRPDVGVRQPQPRVLRGRLHNVLYDDHDDHILILVSRLDSHLYPHYFHLTMSGTQTPSEMPGEVGSLRLD